jgi:hypothetical protein
MPISKLNVQRQEASQVQKLYEDLGSVVGDNTISFPKTYGTYLKEIDSALSSGVTYPCFVAH